MNISLTPDEVLEVALEYEGGVGLLAEALTTPENPVGQNVVSLWRKRGLNHAGWRMALRLKYAQQIEWVMEFRAAKTAGVVSIEGGASHG